MGSTNPGDLMGSTGGGGPGPMSTLNGGTVETSVNSSQSMSITDIGGDEGGGLIIISAADVNGVLTEGDDFLNPEEDDFSTALEGEDYSPISDSFSLEQFFPSVNNVRIIILIVVHQRRT